MSKFEEDCARRGLVARDIKNAIIVNFWLLAWAISLVVLTTISGYEWYAKWMSMSGLAIHIGISVGMIMVVKRFLSEAEDLERKIQLDALALSVGISIVVFSSYSLLEKVIDVPELSAAYLIVIMSIGYALGLIFGRMRLR